METPPFTWYELWKDFLSGDLASVGEKTLIVFQIPEECYSVTFTFILGMFIMIGMLTRTYPVATINIMKHLLGIVEEPPQETIAPSTTVIANFNLDDVRSPAPAPHTPTDSEILEDREKKEKAKRKRDITEEYKIFAPAVLNILGKNIKAEAKVEQLMYKVEDLSKNAIIGYDWDKKLSKSILSLVEQLYPNEDEEEEDSD